MYVNLTVNVLLIEETILVYFLCNKSEKIVHANIVVHILILKVFLVSLIFELVH
jgi:hypothetical protein